MTTALDQTPTATCRRRTRDRRRSHRFVVHDRRSGFDRRRNVCHSPFSVALEAPVLRLRNDPVLLAELLILVNILSAVDLFITFTVLRQGAIELNPVMAFLLDLGPVQATLVKVSLMVAATLGLWVMRRHRAALTTALVLLVVYGSLVVFELVGMVRMLM